MVSASKKMLILMLSLLVGLFNACSNNNPSNAENKPQIKKMILNNQLLKNKNWVKLSKIWKKVNKLESDDTKGLPSNQYKELSESLPLAKKSIDALYEDKLLSKEEKDFLMMIINQRFSYLEYKLGFISCYDMTMLGLEIVKHRDNLEKQYDILEKLFKENKIGTETFTLTKQKINEDMAFIKKNNFSSEGKEYNKNLTNLLIYLNQ